LSARWRETIRSWSSLATHAGPESWWSVSIVWHS